MPNDVTHILQAMVEGDRAAAEQLLPLVYDELRRLAARKMTAEKPGQTLNATALVHEAYLRLVGSAEGDEKKWDGRGHFFAAAAAAMRRILVENARRKSRVKHGAELNRVPLDEEAVISTPASDVLLALDEALTRFAAEEPMAAKVVELRTSPGFRSTRRPTRSASLRHREPPMVLCQSLVALRARSGRVDRLLPLIPPIRTARGASACRPRA